MSAPSYWHRLVGGEARGPGAALARAGLRVASWFYSAGVRIRNKLYDWGVFKTHRLPVPVVSVGNLTVGGTGKTPFVEMLCRKLLALGRRPAVLTRGYKAGAHGSDEAQMLAEHLPGVPVIVNSDRVAGGREAIDKHGADVLVMDDGFQHRRLGRDLDIVLLDYRQGLKNTSRLLPFGNLRESSAGLKRADLIAWTRCGQMRPDDRRRDRDAWLLTRFQPVDVLWWADGAASDGTPQPLDTLQGRRARVFCGIGNPDAFIETVRGLGVVVTDTHVFPDHHEFTPADLADLAAGAEPGTVWVTTEKDLQRLGWLTPDQRRPITPLAIPRARTEIMKNEHLLDIAIERAIRRYDRSFGHG